MNKWHYICQMEQQRVKKVNHLFKDKSQEYTVWAKKSHQTLNPS